MERFRFGPDAAWLVDDYGSAFRLSRLLQTQAGEVRVDVAYLGPGDHIGRHPAALHQLFCVVQGNGWVAGDDAIAVPIVAGEAAFWRAGEPHAVGTDGGLTALIVEAEALDPGGYRPHASAAPLLRGRRGVGVHGRAGAL